MATAYAARDQRQPGVYRRTRGQALEAVRTAHLRRREREGQRRPVVLIDALVEDLEILHLSGRRRVPDAFRQRIDTLRAALPAHRRDGVCAGITITHLLDALFDLRAMVVVRPAHDQATPEDGDLPE